jgi:hypothetical protein
MVVAAARWLAMLPAMIVIWQAIYGSYRLLARRVGRPGAFVGILVPILLAIAWFLVSHRAIVPIIALILLGFSWLWAPAFGPGSFSRWLTLACAVVAVLALVQYAAGH